MLYFTVLFLFFALFVLVRNPKNPNSYFLMASIVGWCLSFLGFLRYLADLNMSSALVQYFYYVPYALWNRLVYAQSDIILSIRFINAGIVLFIAATYLYAVNTFGTKPLRMLHFVPILPLFAELALYDPVFYRYLYRLSLSAGPFAMGFDAFAATYEGLYTFTRFLNIALLTVPVCVLAYLLAKHRRIPVVQYFYLFNTAGLAIVVTVFLFTFNWAPAVLVSIYRRTNYLIFDKPAFIENQVAYGIYPYLSVLSFSVILIAALKYKSIDRILSGKHHSYSRIYRQENFGIRALSHALKNELLAIQFESESLIQGLEGKGELGDSARTIHDLSKGAIGRLNEMHRKIQRRSLVLELVSMNDFLREYERKQLPLLPSDVSASVRPGRLDAKALIDRDHIEECFNVIVKNSVEAFERKGGSIEISSELVGIWVILSFRDDGPGMAPEILERVGEPFFTTKASSSNWGIGLSYVRQIAKMHHGDVAFSSDYGRGAAVRLLLPVVL